MEVYNAPMEPTPGVPFARSIDRGAANQILFVLAACGGAEAGLEKIPSTRSQCRVERATPAELTPDEAFVTSLAL